MLPSTKTVKRRRCEHIRMREGEEGKKTDSPYIATPPPLYMSSSNLPSVRQGRNGSPSDRVSGIKMFNTDKLWNQTKEEANKQSTKWPDK